MPRITILKPIPPDLCDTFAGCFPAGVTRVAGQGSAKTVTVVDPRKDTVSREVLRHPVLQQLVRLDRVRDHFICAYRSTSHVPSSMPCIQSVSSRRVHIRRISCCRGPSMRCSQRSALFASRSNPCTPSSALQTLPTSTL
jgi:DNA-directed RNA polymerase I and III subunit RPAC1